MDHGPGGEQSGTVGADELGRKEQTRLKSFLAAAAPPVWRFCRSFSLDYARMHARRGNVAGVAGQAAVAVMEEAHASGLVRRDHEPYAAYQVHWTKDQVIKHGAEFYIVLGEFGDGTTAADRFAVALHFFVEDDRHGFSIVDANQTCIATHPLVGAIWVEDENIADITDAVAPPSA